jgi:hypothetical protein
LVFVEVDNKKLFAFDYGSFKSFHSNIFQVEESQVFEVINNLAGKQGDGGSIAFESFDVAINSTFDVNSTNDSQVIIVSNDLVLELASIRRQNISICTGGSLSDLKQPWNCQ